MHSQSELQKYLQLIPWFLELDSASIGDLVEIASLHDLEPGEVLFNEGDREDCIYILLEGQVILETEVPTRGMIPFYTAETLDVIGWSSMTPIVRQRTASARVTQRSLLLGFQSELLEQLCSENHHIGYVMMRRIANVVANRLLTTRVLLMDMIAHAAPLESGLD